MPNKKIEQIEIVSSGQLDEKKLKKIKALFPRGTEVGVSIDEKHFKTHVYVTTARELDEETKQLLVSKFGDKSDYHYEIDPSIIGGIIVRTKNKLYDGSIKSKLSHLSQSL